MHLMIYLINFFYIFEKKKSQIVYVYLKKHVQL